MRYILVLSVFLLIGCKADIESQPKYDQTINAVPVEETKPSQVQPLDLPIPETPLPPQRGSGQCKPGQCGPNGCR